MKDDQQLARELQNLFPGEWVALNGDLVVAHARNAATVFREVGENPNVRLVFIEAPREPSSLSDVALVVARAMVTHYPTRGMKVAMGETCECRYWTGSEDPNQHSVRGPGLGGRDSLNWHRAQVAAQALLEAGMIR